MKAILIENFGGPEVLNFKEVEKPKPEKGQVLIKASGISVNFADIKTRKGDFHGAGNPPLIPGLDVAGIIEEVGDGVYDLKVGDKVIAFPPNGSYSEYVVADEILTFKISDDMDMDIAAASPLVLFTSFNLLSRVGRLSKGESVLIHAAAGGIGTTAIQMAKLLGAGTVIGTVGSDEKIQIAKDAGADYVINYRKDSFAEKVKEYTNGNGADVILDSVGSDVFRESLECLAMYGRLVNFNSSSGTPGTLNTKEIHGSCRAVLGFSIGTTIKARPSILKETASEVIPMLESGKIKIVIGNRFSLEDASSAHELIESRKSTGKILLKP